MLLAGVSVRLDIDRPAAVCSQDLELPEGLPGYLREQDGEQEPVAPLFSAEKYAGADDASFANGEGAAWVLGWFEHPVASESYVNLIPRWPAAPRSRAFAAASSRP